MSQRILIIDDEENGRRIPPNTTGGGIKVGEANDGSVAWKPLWSGNQNLSRGIRFSHLEMGYNFT